MRAAVYHFRTRTWDLVRHPGALFLGGSLVAFAAFGGVLASHDPLFGRGRLLIPFILLSIACCSAALVSQTLPVLGGHQTQPALPLGPRARALAGGLAWLPACFVGGLALSAGLWAIGDDLGLEPYGLLGMLLLPAPLVLGGFRPEEKESVPVLPALALGLIAAVVTLEAWEQPLVLVLASGAATLAVLVVGPGLAARGFGWPGAWSPRLFASRPRLRHRRTPGPRSALRQDGWHSLVVGPVKLIPLLLLAVGLTLGLMLAIVGPAYTLGAPHFDELVAAVVVIGLLLGPMFLPFGLPIQGSPGSLSVDTLLATFEHLPVSLREVRLRAFLGALITGAIVLAIAYWQASRVEAPPPLFAPELVFVLVAWSAAVVSAQLGDRVARRASWMTGLAVALPLFAGIFTETWACLPWVWGASAVSTLVLPPLLFRDAPGRA